MPAPGDHPWRETREDGPLDSPGPDRPHEDDKGTPPREAETPGVTAGELNPQNRCHLAVLRSLKENKISLVGGKEGRGVPPVLSPSAPKAFSDDAVDAVEALWKAHDWQGMNQEDAITLLKEHFPAVDVWGEYLRFKEVRSKAGQKPTWRPFLAWLRKASPTMNLGKKKPPKAAEKDPEGWRDFLLREYPKADPDAPYASAPPEVRAEFLR